MTLLIKGTDFCAYPECERLDGGKIIGGLFYCTEHEPCAPYPLERDFCILCKQPLADGTEIEYVAHGFANHKSCNDRLRVATRDDATVSLQCTLEQLI